MSDAKRYVATCPKGLEGLLLTELNALGVTGARETVAAVTFAGDLATAYRACLWSRLASRVLSPLAEFPAADAEALYAGVARIAWEEHLDPRRTIAVRATGTTPELGHTGFTARKVKDAMVDRLRERVGSRPSVDLERPDVLINVRLRSGAATVSIDLSGEPLHRRGYRVPGEQATAPLKENLAAAILMRAGWPQVASAGGWLLDPMCGSGTLLVEAALMSADRAPGLLRDRWGFEFWRGHDASAWDRLIAEADDRAATGAGGPARIQGSDADPAAVAIARDCIRRAGVGDRVQVEQRRLEEIEPPADVTDGLLVTNPPHGIRLSSEAGVADVYAALGDRLRSRFGGWRAAVFTPDPELARATGLRSHKQYSLYNGPTPTKLYLFDVYAVARKADQEGPTTGDR